MIGGMRTIWCSLFAAPRPVGPAPITRMSTFLLLLAEFVKWIHSTYNSFDMLIVELKADVDNGYAIGDTSGGKECNTRQWDKKKKTKD